MKLAILVRVFGRKKDEDRLNYQGKRLINPLKSVKITSVLYPTLPSAEST